MAPVRRRGRTALVLTGVAGALLATACFSSSDTPGLPELEFTFPATAKPGSVHPLRLTVTNPGPEPMGAVVVTFVRVGIDTPIVDGAANNSNPAVVSIRPEPLTVDRAGVVYQFEGLGNEESARITFRLELPRARGVAANSVQVSDGGDPRRVRGVRVKTRVEG